MEQCPPLHFRVVTFEKGAFGSLSTKVANFTYLLTVWGRTYQFMPFPFTFAQSETKTVSSRILTRLVIPYDSISYLNGTAILFCILLKYILELFYQNIVSYHFFFLELHRVFNHICISNNWTTSNDGYQLCCRTGNDFRVTEELAIQSQQ